MRRPSATCQVATDSRKEPEAHILVGLMGHAILSDVLFPLQLTLSLGRKAVFLHTFEYQFLVFFMGKIILVLSVPRNKSHFSLRKSYEGEGICK